MRARNLATGIAAAVLALALSGCLQHSTNGRGGVSTASASARPHSQSSAPPASTSPSP